MDRLQKIQNKAMRIILKVNKYTPIKIMHEMLQWQTVRQRIKYNTMITIHKIKNNLLPEYLNENLKTNRETHTYETRNKNNFRLPKFKKKYTQNNIFYKGLREYNELRQEIKEEERMKIYKVKLRQWIRDKNN